MLTKLITGIFALLVSYTKGTNFCEQNKPYIDKRSDTVISYHTGLRLPGASVQMRIRFMILQCLRDDGAEIDATDGAVDDDDRIRGLYGITDEKPVVGVYGSDDQAALSQTRRSQLGIKIFGFFEFIDEGKRGTVAVCVSAVFIQKANR